MNSIVEILFFYMHVLLTVSKFRFGLIWFLVTLTHITLANTLKTDSLKSELKANLSDSVSLEIYLELGRNYELQNFDSALIFYEQAYQIANNNSWLDKKAKVLANIGFSYLYTLHSQQGIYYLEEALGIYTKTDNKMWQLSTYYNLGYFYNSFNESLKAIDNYNKAVALAIELNDEQSLAITYNNLGLVYFYLGQYEKANEYNLLSLALKEKLADLSGGSNHINLGLSYMQQGQFNKALDHNIKALKYFENNENKAHIALAYKNIGDVYSEMNFVDSAEIYYNRSYQIYLSLKDEESISRHFMVLGVLQQKEGNLVNASKNYQKALELFPKNGSVKLLFAIYGNLSNLHIAFSDSISSDKYIHLTNAVNFASKMEQIAENTGSISMENKSYTILYQAYNSLGNTNKTLEYAAKLIRSKDSLFSEQKQKVISEVQIKYETEKNELEIELLNSENELINIRLSKSNIIRKNQITAIYILVSGFIIILLFVFIILRFYKLTKEANRKLVSKNEVITRQKAEKELLVREIHHRVKNNIQIITSLLDLQYVGVNNPETKATLLDAQSRLKSIALIHQLLSQNEQEVNIDFKDFVTKLSEHIKYSIRDEKNISVHINIPENVQFNIETTLPLGLIINELMTNAFKYAFQNLSSGNIHINLFSQINSKYNLEVIDDGKSTIESFDINKSKSIGLRLVRTLCKQLSCKMDFEIKDGARFSLLFLEVKK